MQGCQDISLKRQPNALILSRQKYATFQYEASPQHADVHLYEAGRGGKKLMAADAPSERDWLPKATRHPVVMSQPSNSQESG